MLLCHYEAPASYLCKHQTGSRKIKFVVMLHRVHSVYDAMKDNDIVMYDSLSSFHNPELNRYLPSLS